MLARARGQRMHVGPVSVLYTIAAIRGVHALAMLTVCDTLEEGLFVRISDDDLRRGVDAMTELAIRVAVEA